MKYIKAILFILSFTVALIFFSCEKGTEPEQLKPGRRDYTWTVDTIKTFNTPLMKMWGTSATNVWAVGSGSSMDRQIWHYDGTKWATDGIWRGILPWCIYGFAQNDIWIGGSDGDIWHYDGNKWSMSLAYSKELNFKYYNIYFMDIWGENPNDVYAVGLADSSHTGLGDVRFGLMMHYNGTEWSRVNIEFTEGILMEIRKGSKTSSKYFMRNVIQNPDSTKFYTFDGKKRDKIYSEIGAIQTLTIIDNEILFNFNKGTYSYDNSIFKLVVENPFSTSWDAVYGRNKKDIIWMMDDGLTHYNGTNFEYILNFENYQFNDGVIRLNDGFVFEKEVFFVTHGNSNNYIFHGVLK
ncbi:MAG: hypothetical protein KKF62_02925 [Bacteroidetes bacterium]|nr:hypothetical protein [Bacteroidota bacterium]MBU1114912.1 hypothetical protein [Bacteroidota bacterium]MBU1800485.1 hypothetical protein [Bacteroidota bacterium]